MMIEAAPTMKLMNEVMASTQTLSKGMTTFAQTGTVTTTPKTILMTVAVFPQKHSVSYFVAT
jgi:hypothetical protein